MAKRVYISPSDQVENKYAWGNTNEHVQCQRIAEAEAAALRRCGVEVQLAKFGTSMAQRCAESNAFGADIHNCVHTNAFNGKVTGTRLFCFAVPGKGYDACRAVFGALAPLTPGTSENIQANSRLYEVRTRRLPPPMWSANFTTIRKRPGGSSSTPMKSARPSPGASASIWGWPMLRPRRKSPRPSPRETACSGCRWGPSPTETTPKKCWKG